LELYKLVTLADKYDLTHLFFPWIFRLNQYITRVFHGFDVYIVVDRWLWVTWELGLRDLFEKLFQFMVFRCNGDGTIVIYGSSSTQKPFKYVPERRYYE
jgi:hypothetical protein